MSGQESMTVMVTGVGGGGHGEQIMKALRLAQTRYTIVGGDMLATSKGLFEVDIPYVLPAATDPVYLDAVLAVCRRHGVRALFHGSEPELKVMSRERERIADAGIFLPINPAEVIELCMDKHRTMEFLSREGFSHPRFAKIRSQADAVHIDFLPAILKPSIGGGGSINTFLAQTPEEAHLFGRYLLDMYPEFIAQEYVGTPECEYTVGVLLSMDGDLIHSIAVKRSLSSGLSVRFKAPNRSGRKDLGETLVISSGYSQGEIGPFPEATRPCEEIAMRLKARGAVNIQCRLAGGKVYPFEINPRFSGTTSLRAMAGYNEPDILIRKHCLGQRIEARFAYQSGVIMRGLNEIFLPRLDLRRAVDLL